MKKYIKVSATFDCDGNLLPENIIWENNRKFPISRITGVSFINSEGSGAMEIKYTCIIMGHKRDLFFENNRWFVNIK